MNKAVLIVLILLLVFGAGFESGIWYAKPTKPVWSGHPAVANTQPTHVPPIIGAPTARQWQEYQTTREKTLRENPDLAAEYQGLLAEVKKHQADIEAAMVKSDPKVAPIVAKLALIRERNMTQAVPATK